MTLARLVLHMKVRIHFYVHKQSDNELTSLVLTNDIAYKNNAEYLDKNRHWQETTNNFI